VRRHLQASDGSRCAARGQDPVLGLGLAILFGLLASCASTPPPHQPAAAPEPALARRPPAEERPAARRGAAEGPPEIVIVAGGDVIFGRYIRGELRRVGGDAPFEHIAERMRAADLAFVNLETPITDHEPTLRRNPFGRDLTFRAPTDTVPHLVSAGIDVVATANNHAEDCGPIGIADTLHHLEAAGIRAVGSSPDGDPFAPVSLELPQGRVTFIAATSKRNRGTPAPGQRVPIAFMTTLEMLERLPGKVRALRAAGPADLIVVSLHWGAGFQRALHSRQIAVARALVDAGADLILGHHAHILQGVEARGDGFIVYGMGNLVFDMRDRRGRESALYETRLVRRDGRWRAEEHRIHPLLIDHPRVGPRPVDGAEARRILKPVARQSAGRLGTPLTWSGDSLVWRRPASAP